MATKCPECSAELERVYKIPVGYERVAAMGLWTGLGPIQRLLLSPIYAAVIVAHCLAGKPVQYQLHREVQDRDE